MIFWWILDQNLDSAGIRSCHPQERTRKFRLMHHHLEQPWLFHSKNIQKLSGNLLSCWFFSGILVSPCISSGDSIWLFHQFHPEMIRAAVEKNRSAVPIRNVPFWREIELSACDTQRAMASKSEMWTNLQILQSCRSTNDGIGWNWSIYVSGQFSDVGLQ